MSEDRYETIPAVVRSELFGDAWLISALEWGSAPEEPMEVFEADEVVGVSDIFSDIFSSQAFGPVVIDCARCGQKLSVPIDKGRLRVTCPKCTNVQWFEP
jgi:predicted nucleic-acid-binding Zn-ribbon protein